MSQVLHAFSSLRSTSSVAAAPAALMSANPMGSFVCLTGLLLHEVITHEVLSGKRISPTSLWLSLLFS